MVRRSKDGMLRFSSYNDVARTLSGYTPEIVQGLIGNVQYGKRDKVAALLETQDLLDEIISISSQALGACYSLNITDTVTDNVQISDVRVTLINRLRRFIAEHAALGKQLDSLALLQATKYNLAPPAEFNLALSRLQTERIDTNWQYVRTETSLRSSNGKSQERKQYALYYVATLYAAEAFIRLADSDDAPVTYVAADYPDMRAAYTTAKMDKVIGVSSTRYNQQQQRNPPRGKHALLENWFMFYADLPVIGNLQPQQFIALSEGPPAGIFEGYMRDCALRMV